MQIESRNRDTAAGDELGTGKKSSNLDLGYNYERAISEANRLWNELKMRHASRQWMYPPTEASFLHLLGAWETRPGKALVHMFDLPDFVHVRLNPTGIEQLRSKWENLVAKYKFRGAFRNHGAVYHTVVGQHQTISIRALKKLSIESDTNIEQTITEVRAGANGKSLVLGLPMRIDTEGFAALFGFYGDLIHRKVSHVTKDEEVQNHFIASVLSSLGQLNIATWKRGLYNHAYATSFLQHVLTAGGLNTSVRQIEADNPAPLFLFASPNDVVRANLRGLFESEGGVSYSAVRNAPGSVDLHQAILCNPERRELVPRHPGRTSFRKLGSPPDLLDTPPRILTATSLLLLRFNISSRLWPADLYTNDLDECVMRWRLMITGSDIANFRECVGFISGRKKALLQGNL